MPVMRNERFFIITGPEGAGKTTLVGRLAGRGVSTVIESTRDVWIYQESIGGRCLPFSPERTYWQKMAYFEMALAFDMRSYTEAGSLPAGPVIFDRGIPDIIVFLEYSKLPVQTHVKKAAEIYRYNPVVFLAPFWQDIYETDPQRTSTPFEAASQQALCERTYSLLGYDVITLPLVSVDERADFILEHIRPDQDIRSPLRAVS